uniref:Lectizyme n=1 Tax=Lygus hesperus TaxID=30085 RepID=A0A0A9WLD6_LYGHE
MVVVSAINVSTKMDLCLLSCSISLLIIIQLVENHKVNFTPSHVDTIKRSEDGVPLPTNVSTSYTQHNTKIYPEPSPRSADSDDEGRIINGQPANPGEFPFMVSIQNYYTWGNICGGSLVSIFHVLTACHCLVYDVTGVKPTLCKI